MQILLKCIKMLRRRNDSKKDIRTTIYDFEYITKEIGLGQIGEATSGDKNYIIDFSYEKREDIIHWRLKRNNPYSILFSYIDGAYIINDSRTFDYDSLISKFNLIKSYSKKQQYTETYAQLEKLTAEFIKEYFHQ